MKQTANTVAISTTLVSFDRLVMGQYLILYNMLWKYCSNNYYHDTYNYHDTYLG